MKPCWEHFHHGADIGVRGIATTLEQAFAQAALAMTAVVCEPQRVSPRHSVTIECQAPDHELLLVDWLNALIFEMSTRNMLFSEFSLQIGDHQLHAICRGEPIDLSRHQPAVEIKGATYTELSVRHQDDYWLAQTVVDV